MVLDKPSGQVYLPIEIKKADTFASRLLGLMFRKHLPENEALWIVPCNSIHMFFMRFPIDVLLLDTEGKIIKIIESLSPWSVVWPVRSAQSVIEMPAGTIQQYKLEPGDKLLI